MALAHKCDFCGNYYESSVIRKIIVRIGGSIYDTEFDMCKECENSFFIWKELRNHDHKTAFEDKEDSIVYGNLFDGN